MSLQETVEFIAVQSKKFRCLVIGQAVGAATLRHESFEHSARKILIRGELLCDFVGQFEGDLQCGAFPLSPNITASPRHPEAA